MNSQGQFIGLFKLLSPFLFYPPEMRRHEQQLPELGIVKRKAEFVFPAFGFIKKLSAGRGVLVLLKHLVIYDAFQFDKMLCACRDLNCTAAFFEYPCIFLGHEKREYCADNISAAVSERQMRGGRHKPENIFVAGARHSCTLLGNIYTDAGSAAKGFEKGGIIALAAADIRNNG